MAGKRINMVGKKKRKSIKKGKKGKKAFSGSKSVRHPRIPKGATWNNTGKWA